MTVDALILCAILVGLLRGFAKSALGRVGIIIANIGTGAGLCLACYMSYMKNATNKVDTSLWNYRIFWTGIIAAGAFIVLSLVLLLVRPLHKGKAGLIMRIAVSLCVLVSIALSMLYAMPDVIAYPYTILLTDMTALSTDYLFKMIGILLGVILMLLYEMAMYRGMQRLKGWQALIVLDLGLLANGLRWAGKIIQVMVSKRMILPTDPDFDRYFDLAVLLANNDISFTYIMIGISFLVPVVIWVLSFLQKEPYSNPAGKRKIKKKYRVNRRWAVLGICCTAMMLVSIFVIEPYTNRPVVLSPVEDCRVQDGNVYVTFEQVEDGHLHRFEYKTPNGKHVRFIVIKKPNSQSYGIGLDACDICGETGYYERDGQVVCKLCDVVMNINTIGFKGGCNPIVVPYSIENGNIVLPVKGLIEHENEFKA